MSLDQYEAEARKQAQALEDAGRLPYGFTAQHYPLTPSEQRELRRYKAAGQAAHDVDTYLAMCKGDIVPTHRVDQTLLAYHRRRVQHRQPPRADGD